MRTTLGTCVRKARYASAGAAAWASHAAPFTLRPYRCELCRHFHLTSRSKGMFVRSKCDKAAP